MTIQDGKLLFSEDQAETTVAAHDSTNTLDLSGGKAKNAFGTAIDVDPGAGGDLWLNIVVTEAVESGGSATVQFKLEESANDSSWSDTTLITGDIGKASLVQGYKPICAPLPKDLKRYLKVTYTIGTSVLTAGKFSAWIGQSAHDS